MTTDLSVNSAKLTVKRNRIGGIERQVLMCISQGMTGDKYLPAEGCCMSWLIKQIYGFRGMDGGSLGAVQKAAVSRALHGLFRKGMVKMGIRPSRGHLVWSKPYDGERDYGFYGYMTHSEHYVSVTMIEREDYSPEDYNQFTCRQALENNEYFSQLPMGTRKWWVLTDKGRAYAQGLKQAVTA